MKIGLDLDFTITELPEFFSILSTALMKAGHEVFIITYRDEELKPVTISQLTKMHIRYTKLFMPEGDVDMAKWKGKLAEDLDLDIMIDDSPEVLDAMPPKTRRMWLCDPNVFSLRTCLEALKKK